MFLVVLALSRVRMFRSLILASSRARLNWSEYTDDDVIVCDDDVIDSSLVLYISDMPR